MSKRDLRTPEQIKEHYEIEKELASRLRQASREERRTFYKAVYDELFQRVPHHSQLTRKMDVHARQQLVVKEMKALRHFLRPHLTFLEVGPGDCRLSFEVAKRVKKVIAVDVSEEITRHTSCPDNFELILSDGCSVPVPPHSIDIVYSHQLMEHLHPDDALEQLENIYAALAPGGVYICITPNRLSGPHDISRHFDESPTGLHLREYTTTELVNLFRSVGFSEFQIFLRVKQIFVLLPVLPSVWAEWVLERLPRRLAKPLAAGFPIRKILDNVVARK
jgi:SAM-dependent methyltransferase